MTKATKNRTRRRGRGSLALIGGLLIASAVVRTGSAAGEAIALEMIEEEDANIATERPDGGMGKEDIAPVLKALSQREERVKQRESDIRVRMQALSVAETEIDRKMAALVQAEEQLRATLALAQTAAEDDLTQLTDVYANMKPKQAAALFEEMDPEFAAGFLGRMRTDAAAAIMAGLSPTAAYTVSVVLAGRNADVPKN